MEAYRKLCGPPYSITPRFHFSPKLDGLKHAGIKAMIRRFRERRWHLGE